MVEDVGDDPTRPVSRQLIAAACDGVLQSWLQDASSEEEHAILQGLAGFGDLKGDNERWKQIKKALTGKAVVHKWNYRDKIELTATPDSMQMEAIEKGCTARLEFQFRCKEVLDEMVPLQLLGMKQWLDMNRQGVQSLVFDVDGSTFSDKVLELFIEGDQEPLWRRQRGADKYTFDVNGVPFTMIKVCGGKFWMGSSDNDKLAETDEKPRHKVILDDYYIAETPVTQALWKAVVNGQNYSRFKGDENPVENVDGMRLHMFLSMLNIKLQSQLPKDRKFRLPTEAEWEFAARGRIHNGTKYSGSNNLYDVAWHEGNSNGSTHPVKSKQPNELGLFDMSGNVWEICNEKYGPYSLETQTNPMGFDKGVFAVHYGSGLPFFSHSSPDEKALTLFDSALRSHVGDKGEPVVLRGGCYRSEPKSCRVASRSKAIIPWTIIFPFGAPRDYGFRLAMS